jgi:hypothetical protein
MTLPRPRSRWMSGNEGMTRHYLHQLPGKLPPPVRFDVLSVYLVPGKEKEFMHFEAAFGWQEREYELR